MREGGKGAEARTTMAKTRLGRLRGRENFSMKLTEESLPRRETPIHSPCLCGFTRLPTLRLARVSLGLLDDIRNCSFSLFQERNDDKER